MARESTVARESGAQPLNAVSRVLTRRRISGWANTYAPKNLRVNVGDWLKENEFNVSDDDLAEIGTTTFKDYGSERDRLYFLDTFLRDAVEEGFRSIKRR